MTAHVRTAGRQRGSALLVAMLTLTLIATLAAGMVWQQFRAVQIEAAERARTQSAWILGGALDWARLVLRQDADADNRAAERSDNLSETWATALAESRLSTFLGADENNVAQAEADGGIEAFLSGRISDAQARYNLRNLVDLGDQESPAARTAELRILARLCETVGLPQDVALRISVALRGSTAAELPEEPPSGPAAPEVPSDQVLLAPTTVEQLAWLDIEPEVIQRLRPFVELLPTRTTVNLNTAPAEVLAAVIENLDRASAERLVQARQSKPFTTLAAAAELLPPSSAPDARHVGVVTSHFEVRGLLRYEDAVLEERSIVRREELEVVPIRRERVRPGG